MFNGRHDHTIDKKGRVSVPAVFRTEILRRGDGPPMLTRDDDHLALYPRDDWDKIVAEFAGWDPLDQTKQSYIRHFVGNAAECPIDSQGRILVPPKLRAHAGLEGKVSLVGMIAKIEIWNEDLCENEDNVTQSNLPDIKRQVRRSPGSKEN